MKKTLFLALFVVFLFLSPTIAKPTTIKVTSKIHPRYIIEEIKSKPYIFYFTLGKFYFKIGKIDNSMGMFEKTIELNPDFAPAYHNLGVVYYEKKEYDNALTQFKKAVGVDNSYTKCHYSLAILYFEMGDFDNAINTFSRVVELQPNNVNANFDLAQSYVARFRKNEENNNQNYDDLERALFYLKIVEGLQPGFPYVKNNIEVIQSIVGARKILLNQTSSLG